MLAILLAALVAAAPQSDTVFTSDGGRVRGTVVEESAKGVTVQLVDGTTRTFEPAQVIRIEYADGTVSTPRPAAPPPPPAVVAPQAAPPPPAAAAPQAAPPYAPAPHATTSAPPDVLYFADGGRGRGLVVEETPAGGVTVRMGDGTVRRYPPGQVIRIEYGDGTVSVPRPVQRAYPPAPPPPPRVVPPPPPQAAPVPPPKPVGMPPISPFYFSLGLGGSFQGGEAEKGYKMDDMFQPQVDVLLEAGVRVSPAVALGLYLDIGAGDFATRDPTVSAWCATGAGNSCSAANFRLGALLKHTWDPAARSSPWLAIGTGWEAGGVYLDDMHQTNVVWYEGWEMLRLMGGVDLRSNQVFGIGLYAAVSFGSYSRAEYLDPATSASVQYDVTDRTFHSTVSAGLKFTLFP